LRIAAALRDARWGGFAFPGFHPGLFSMCPFGTQSRIMGFGCIQHRRHQYRVPPTFDTLPSYNIAPQTFQAVIRPNRETGERELAQLRWGPHSVLGEGRQNRIQHRRGKGQNLRHEPGFPRSVEAAPVAGCSVTVHQHLDRTLSITHGPRRLGHYISQGESIKTICAAQAVKKTLRGKVQK